MHSRVWGANDSLAGLSWVLGSARVWLLPGLLNGAPPPLEDLRETRQTKEKGRG